MSSASEELDNPLYGDFEDYLDGKLPPARHREVADLLARSAAAREMLEELRTARKWLEGTHWDVPEPSGWPSAGEILARAGWRPAASLPAAKPDRSTGRFAGWLSGWMPWQWNVRSPVWVFGAAASVLLLVGGGLWWWVLSPSAPDELAQSKASETSAPPTSELPAQPGAATARPEDAARPVLPAEAAPVGAAPQKRPGGIGAGSGVAGGEIKAFGALSRFVRDGGRPATGGSFTRAGVADNTAGTDGWTVIRGGCAISRR